MRFCGFRAIAIAGLAALLAAGSAPSRAQEVQVYPRISAKALRYFQTHPAEWGQLLDRMRMPARAAAAAPAPPTGSPWQPLTNQLGSAVGNPLLLTDGSVIVQSNSNFSNWFKLTQDNTGSYVNGTWSQIASLPSGYGPLFYASAVLPDGRVVAEGGEYNCLSGDNSCSAVWMNKGAIYDPLADRWTALTPPPSNHIGDAQGIVLANGTFMLADCCAIAFGDASNPLSFLLNAQTLSWSSAGTNKADDYDEEGWTLLPDGRVLTVDANTTTACGTNSEIYDPSSGGWSSAGSTVVTLPDCSNPSNNPSDELGPQVLRPDGTLVAFGGTLCGDDRPTAACVNGTTTVTSHTSIYNGSSWSQGPDLPTNLGGRNYSLADAPAALLPSGNILFAASPNYRGFTSPTHFFEFTAANQISQVADTTDAPGLPAFEWQFLVLPSGQVLAMAGQAGTTVWIYTPSGIPSPTWAPVITSAPSILAPGTSYQLTGRQLNGLSQGAAYGDDVQGATNYPIVRITNNRSGHVFFARTSGSSNSSIAPNNPSTVNFAVPANVELGASSLVAVANGIPSAPVSVTVGSAFSLSASVSGNGTVTSSPAGINCGATCSASFGVGTQVTLTATPAAGWRFAGWGGACSGTGGCTVTVNANTSVSATFAPITFSLAVSKIGSGGGTVTSSPSGIDCGATCSASFGVGTQVTLTATPTSGFGFAGWSGAGCSGTGTCTVSMTANQGVSATFTQITYTLSVGETGSGSVTSAPSGIDCGSTCSANFNSGTQVTLTATPASGFGFAGWSGAGCSGTGSCTVSMTGDQSVSATFTQSTHTLSVSVSGGGTVTSSPSGINCGSTCSAIFNSGTQVTLTAAPAGGLSFAGWNGAGCGGTGTCTVSMNADQSVSATFAPTVFALSVSVSGSGTVTSSPSGIDCSGGTCTASFPSGTQVALAQSAAGGSGFAGWGGACNGAGTCALTLNAAARVSASFTQGAPPASPLLASVLPASRSVQVGNTATAFAAIINTASTTAPGCAVAPSSSIPSSFAYQTTDPATNALTGSPNTPIDIAAGGLQTFVVALTPNAAFGPANLPFSFACANVAPAPVQIGLNTLLLSASAGPVPDIVALAATTRNDGIVHVPGSAGAGAFAVATVNVGAEATIAATATTGSAELPLTVTLCQTNPSTGACLAAPATSVTTDIAASATPTFGIFVKAAGSVGFNPADNRIFVQFSGTDGVIRGATSVAVTTTQ